VIAHPQDAGGMIAAILHGADKYYDPAYHSNIRGKPRIKQVRKALMEKNKE
jgi:hypothetical protein